MKIGLTEETACAIDIRAGNDFSPLALFLCYAEFTSNTLPKRWNISYEFQPVMLKVCMLRLQQQKLPLLDKLLVSLSCI